MRSFGRKPCINAGCRSTEVRLKADTTSTACLLLDACDPSHDAASAPTGRSLCSSGRETRGFSAGGGYLAGMSACLSFSLRKLSGDRPDVRKIFRLKDELGMLANPFSECQCAGECVRVCLLTFSHRFRQSFPSRMHVWSLPKVFHNCGKNCGNSTRSVIPHGLRAS